MGGSSQVQEDFIFVHGTKTLVSRLEMRREIEQVSRRHNLDNEEAWNRVKENLASFFEKGSLPPTNAPNQKPSRDVFTLEMQQPKAVPPQAEPDVKHNDNFDPANEVLPPHLRNSGLSVMEAIASGQLNVVGEHPDAGLLRQAFAESSMFGLDGVAQEKPATKAIKERQLLFPFRVPQNVRIMPTDFNQTSLFHVASNNSERRFFKNEIMGRIGDQVTLYYYGEELRHEDEAIVLQLIHLARGRAPGEYIDIRTVAFHRGARGSTRVLSKADVKSVNDSLQRMRGGYVMVRNAQRNSFITVNLIRDLQGDGNMRRIMIDPCFVALLDSFTTMDQDVLINIRGVARQLFKYISTKPFATLYPTKVMSYFELCYGSLESLTAHYQEKHPNKSPQQVRVAMTKKISDFRCKTLPEQLDELKSRELIIGYSYDETEDKVSIVKSSDHDTANKK